METKQAILERRSIRSYADTQISKDELQEILNAAYCSQAGGVLSGAHFIQPEECSIHFNHDMEENS